MVERTPDVEVLRRYVDRGLSLEEMTLAWYAESGWKIDRPTVARALERQGIAVPQPPQAPYGKVSRRTRDRIEGVIILLFLAMILYPIVVMIWRTIS